MENQAPNAIPILEPLPDIFYDVHAPKPRISRLYGRKIKQEREENYIFKIPEIHEEKENLTEEEKLEFMKKFYEFYAINNKPSAEHYDDEEITSKNIQLVISRDKENSEIREKMYNVMRELESK